MRAYDQRDDPDRSDRAGPLRLTDKPRNARRGNRRYDVTRSQVGYWQRRGRRPRRNLSPQDGTLLVPRRPAHYLPTPARAVFVEDLVGGQHGPQVLYTLPVGHTSSPSQI